jgi:hypothetical protein
MQIYLMLLRVVDMFTASLLNNNCVYSLVFKFCVFFFCFVESQFYNDVIVNYSSPFLPSAVS